MLISTIANSIFKLATIHLVKCPKHISKLTTRGLNQQAKNDEFNCPPSDTHITSEQFPRPLIEPTNHVKLLNTINCSIQC